MMLAARKARRGRGFSLVELLVVMMIIGVLIALLMPVLQKARRLSAITNCKNNLQQIHLALRKYQAEWGNGDDSVFPYRVTHLAAQLAQDKVFLCPSDTSHGTAGGKPANVPANQQYPEIYETGQEVGTKPCSYLYELSGAPCSWVSGAAASDFIKNVTLNASGDPTTFMSTQPADFDPSAAGWANVSWCKTKMFQMKNGDRYWYKQNKAVIGYAKSKFPIMRCWWHTYDPTDQAEQNVVNLSYEKRIFMSGPHWEESAKN
jgi:prepilin-type N-terminal cleavage/methylation domain-containing protein